jgi:hypothetical protein
MPEPTQPTKINVTTNGTTVEGVEPCKKAKVETQMTYKELQALLKKKREELKAKNG